MSEIGSGDWEGYEFPDPVGLVRFPGLPEEEVERLVALGTPGVVESVALPPKSKQRTIYSPSTITAPRKGSPIGCPGKTSDVEYVLPNNNDYVRRISPSRNILASYIVDYTIAPH